MGEDEGGKRVLPADGEVALLGRRHPRVAFGIRPHSRAADSRCAYRCRIGRVKTVQIPYMVNLATKTYHPSSSGSRRGYVLQGFLYALYGHLRSLRHVGSFVTHLTPFPCETILRSWAAARDLSTQARSERQERCYQMHPTREHRGRLDASPPLATVPASVPATRPPFA